MPSVQYWKYKDSVPAKVVRSEDGSIIMKMEGEKQPFPTFPRGHLLFGKLSKLKHEIKNQIFNESWHQLEKGTHYRKDILEDIKRKWDGEITEIGESMKYEMLPEKSMCLSMRELYRAWTKVGGDPQMRDIITFILQEDDGYRNRFQWMVKYFNPSSWWFKLLKKDVVKEFDYAFEMLEHGEVINDMKERVRLVRIVMRVILEDSDFFKRLCKEIDWNKVKLSKADMYHFRGKYFKCDYDILEY